MADVAITKKCQYTIQSWSLSRSGATMTAKWTIPANATNKQKDDRATCHSMMVDLNSNSFTAGDGTVAFYWFDDTTLKKTSYSFNLKAGGKYLRIQSNLYAKGSNLGCKDFIKTQKFEVPLAPTVNDIEYNTDTGVATFKISGHEATFARPRMNYHMNVWREGISNGSAIKKTQIINTDCLGWDANNTLTYSKTYTESAKIAKETDYIHYIFEAYAIGTAGNSTTIRKEFYIAHPAKPTITGFSKVTGGANVLVKSNKTAARPTETLQLQVQYSDVTDTSKLPDTGWTNIGSSAPWNSQSIYISDSDIENTVGQHVYIRCVASSQTREIPSDVYPVNDKIYYWSESGRETEETSVVEIIKDKTTYGSDSESIDVVIGYDESTDYNACEISYSTDSRAWLSTEQPTTYQMKDSYWRDDTSQSSTHPRTSSISILGLDGDTTYYLKARRYITTDETKTSKWSAMVKQNTSKSELTGLVLTASETVAINKDCSFTWQFPDEVKQIEWHLYDGDTKTELEGGTGSITSTTHTFASTGFHNAYLLAVFEDGRSMTSDLVVVSVVDPPTLSFSKAPTSPLTTLPQTFSIDSDIADASIKVKVLSYGVKSYKPDGTVEQYYNDVVYSTTGIGSVSCTLDKTVKLWQNTTYQIVAVATANGVTSDILRQNFEVSYSDTITLPADSDVVVTPNENLGATIQVKNLTSGTQWDLYRSTEDERNTLISSDNESDATITDNFAPYNSNGECKYIVLIHNDQNQFDYGDYFYSLSSYKLRFDWGKNSVELPYNLKISDSNDKQFEQQVYLDGTQKGSWGASVVRTASLSTDTIYLKDADVISKVRELARYQGAVFVRTPLGQAFCANVEVDEISKSYDSPVVAVSFNCTEIDLTDDYKAQKNS